MEPGRQKDILTGIVLIKPGSEISPDISTALNFSSPFQSLIKGERKYKEPKGFQGILLFQMSQKRKGLRLKPSNPSLTLQLTVLV